MAHQSTLQNTRGRGRVNGSRKDQGQRQRHRACGHGHGPRGRRRIPTHAGQWNSACNAKVPQLDGVRRAGARSVATAESRLRTGTGTGSHGVCVVGGQWLQAAWFGCVAGRRCGIGYAAVVKVHADVSATD